MSEATQIIAIDGPVGTGKSSVARTVAQRLGYAFLDTGAMYRAATWWATHNNIDLNDPTALVKATYALPLKMEETPEGLRVWAGEHDITQEIRSAEVTRQIYKLDQIPEVRAHLVTLQRKFGEQQPTVAEGRDIGTVVFPKAHCKIYLDASLDERTRRRANQLRESGKDVDEVALRQEIAERDAGSMEREHSPLRLADDAVRIDTTSMNFEDVVNAIITLAKERL